MPTDPPPFAHVFGCSHSKYFFTPRRLRLRIAPDTRYPRIGGQFIRAASVAGFRPRTSTLKSKEIIAEALPRVQRLVLAFGQVDLELGYYFRRVVKGEVMSPEAYVDWLVSIYIPFVEGFAHAPSALALKGVNLTVLTSPGFTANYVERIVGANLESEALAQARDRLREHLLTADQQNALSLMYNDKLRMACASRGYRYFDLNDKIAAAGPDGRPDPSLGIDERYIPASFDHHLVDSAHVRRLHLAAVSEVFA